MLSSIIQLSLRHRGLVVVASLALLIYGSYLATELPIDVFPDLDRPRVVLLTECPGLATEEVEKLVTQPLEASLLGAAGVEAVRSQSTAGLAVIFVEFDWTVDVRYARQTVQERLASVTSTLPEGIQPQLTPTASIMGQIVIAGLSRRTGPNGGRLAPIPTTDLWAERIDSTSGPPQLIAWKVIDRNDLSTWQQVKLQNIQWQESPVEQVPGEFVNVAVAAPSAADNARNFTSATFNINGQPAGLTFPSELTEMIAIRDLADWVVRPRLRKIPGIAEVFVQGGERKQYQVKLLPTALQEYGVSLTDVEEAIHQSNQNASGGFSQQGEMELPIRIIGRLGPNPDDILHELRQIPVRADAKRPVVLEQVAEVTLGAQLKRGDGAINGSPGVVFTLAKQPHVDTRAATDAIEKTLSEIEQTLAPDLVMHSKLFQLRNFIDRGIFNVGEALVIGAVLVLIVLMIFLMNVRTTFITLTAIPLSLVITTLVFRLISSITGSPLSINVMTLGGIAVAMGELVDDAIVDVENIFRRLHENSRLAKPLPSITVVYRASQEVRSAIVFGTAVVILVFLPLFALSGVEGRLFAPLGLAYIVSILASLFVSLTVTPVLSSYLLPQATTAHHAQEGWLLTKLKLLAMPLLKLSIAQAPALLVITWIASALAVWQLAMLGRNFLPAFDEGSVQVNVTLPAGSSLAASTLVSRSIDQKLRSWQKTPENPDGEILQFVRRTGRAELDEHAMPVSASEYILAMNPEGKRHREEVIEGLLHELREDAPGVDMEVEQPLAHMISHMVSGVYAQIAVKVYGDDLDTLLESAARIQKTLQTIDGITPPVIEPIQLAKEKHIQLRGNDLAHYGLTRQRVAEQLETALQGRVVSQVLEGERRFDLLVRLDDHAHRDFELDRMLIDLPDGKTQVQLSEIATIGEVAGPTAVFRENARRRIVIRCNTQGRDLSSAVAEIREKVGREIQLPPGYFIEYGGQFESQERATLLILMLAGVSVVGMLVVLMLLYPSLRVALQILNALPTAFIGGVAALVITDQTLSVASLVGFISLGGIAVRNGVLLVTHYVHLMREENEPFSAEMIIRGSLERLAPVLMTALTAGIGLVPLVLGGNEPGREILYPVATVILGGLVTSTLCEFLIHPGLFFWFSGKDAARLARRDDADDQLFLGEEPSATVKPATASH